MDLLSSCGPVDSFPEGPIRELADEAQLAANKKMLQQRKHLVNELLETEKTYLVLLEFIAKVRDRWRLV